MWEDKKGKKCGRKKRKRKDTVKENGSNSTVTKKYREKREKKPNRFVRSNPCVPADLGRRGEGVIAFKQKNIHPCRTMVNLRC